MQTHARVVVIGGGVVGCSVLYHLARGGWSDVMLLERSELTSGSTWHAAGGCHTINGDPNVAKLQKYTIDLYKEIEELSGQATGFHMTGGVMLASTPERFDWLKSTLAKGRYLDIEAEIITPEEAHADIRHEELGHVRPLMQTSMAVDLPHDEGDELIVDEAVRDRSDGRSEGDTPQVRTRDRLGAHDEHQHHARRRHGDHDLTEVDRWLEPSSLLDVVRRDEGEGAHAGGTENR